MPPELGEIYSRYAHRIHNHVLLLVWNEEDAWDITQDAFAQLLAFLQRGHTVHAPVALLFRAATKRAIRMLRMMTGRKERITRLNPPELPSDESLHEFWSVFRHVWSRMDAKGKVILKMWAHDRMTTAEIAEHSGIAPRTIKRRIKEIRTVARKMRDEGEKIGPILDVGASIGVGEGEEPS